MQERVQAGPLETKSWWDGRLPATQESFKAGPLETKKISVTHELKAEDDTFLAKSNTTHQLKALFSSLCWCRYNSCFPSVSCFKISQR
jgi:hypothetical protein